MAFSRGNKKDSLDLRAYSRDLQDKPIPGLWVQVRALVSFD
jgi:hypothetical protein